MAELSDSDLERLERYDAMSAEERAAFDAELAARPELREALEGARAVAAALPSLAEPSLSDAKADQLVRSSIPTKQSPLARWWPALVAAGLMAFGYARFGVDTVQSVGGTVTVDARTLVAGEQVISGNVVVTGESSGAFVKRHSSKWIVAPLSQVRLRGNVLERGAVVVFGRAPVNASAHAIDVDGEVLISMEPSEGSFRETSHLEPGDVMNPRVLATAAVVGGLSVYVLSGSAWVTPPDAMPSVHVEAGKSWNIAAPTRTTKHSTPFEQWPADDAPRLVDVTDAGAPPVVAMVVDVPEAVVPTPVKYTVDRRGIQTAIHSRKADLHECYDSWSQQQPGLGGSMNVAFVIDVNDAGVGGVRDLHVLDGGIGHAMFEGCILNVMSDLTFDPPREPLNVTYPFVFSVDGGE